MHFALSMLIFVKLISVKNALEGPPRTLPSQSHRLINFAHVNDSVTLKCPVESSSDFKTFVDWTKGKISLYNEQGYEITPKGYLKIKTVASQHSGIYTCEAINGYGSTRVNVTLVVVHPEVENSNFTILTSNSANRIHPVAPSITKRPSSLSEDAGSEATFHCISTGHPIPRIFWLKEGHLIQGSSSYVSKRKTHSTLKLKALKKSDSGHYKCIARNTVGEDETDFELHVSEASPPPKILALDPPTITIEEGANIAFVCEVDTRPGVKLHIKWLKKQEDINDLPESNDINLFRSGNLYYRPLNFTDNEVIVHNNVYKSKLFIRNTGTSDAGTYVCLALNDKGFNVRNSTLKVIGTHRMNRFASKPHSPESNNMYLALTVTLLFLLILGVIILVPSYFWCRSKPEEKQNNVEKSLSKVESRNFKHSTTSVRKPTKGDMAPFPEISEPPSTSKLLGIDSSMFCEHTESQVSKSVHTRNSFY